MTRIGGNLGMREMALLYGSDTDARAQERQWPVDRDTARVAALELARRGLTPRDIAAALRLSEGAVRQLLGSAPPSTNYPPNTNGITK